MTEVHGPCRNAERGIGKRQPAGIRRKPLRDRAPGTEASDAHSLCSGPCDPQSSVLLSVNGVIPFILHLSLGIEACVPFIPFILHLSLGYELGWDWVLLMTGDTASGVGLSRQKSLLKSV